MLFQKYKTCIKIRIGSDFIEACDGNKYITKSTLIKAWGKKLFDEFASVDFYARNPYYSSYEPMRLYSMTRVKLTESLPEFIAKWKKRNKLDENYFKETNYYLGELRR